MTKLVKFLIIFGLLAGTAAAQAQGVRYNISPMNADMILNKEHIRSTVDYLTDPALGGRKTGSEGA